MLNLLPTVFVSQDVPLENRPLLNNEEIRENISMKYYLQERKSRNYAVNLTTLPVQWNVQISVLPRIIERVTDKARTKTSQA